MTYLQVIDIHFKLVHSILLQKNLLPDQIEVLWEKGGVRKTPIYPRGKQEDILSSVEDE